MCVKFDTFAKFNESVHSGPDALSEAVVGRLEDLLEALGDTFGPLDGLMEACWSFLEAPWPAKVLF